MSGQTGKKMALGLFYQSLGHHVAAWRDPSVDASAHQGLAHFTEIARRAEDAKFDFMFTADTYATFGPDDPEQWARTMLASRHEPFTLSAALAAVTSRIGLVLTATTTFFQPMQVARLFAGLDQWSGGRSGWNVVTSSTQAEAYNFGLDALPDAGDRYRRAEEFVDVVQGLWDSWERDAFIGDKDEGLFLDKDKVHKLNHEGEHFKVRGPLPIPRSPQGQPVIVQAGQSGPGIALAGRTAEVVFTIQQTVEDARKYYEAVKSAAESHGRDRDHIKVLPGITIMVAPTKAEAEDRFDRLQKLIPENVGVSQLSALLRYDISGYPLDEPMPEIERYIDAGHGRVVYQNAREQGLTIRQTYEKFVGQRGHRVLVGDAVTIADDLEHWFTAGGCDGFNIMPPTFPRDLGSIADLLVPELQRRGLMRTEYEGTTLREHLGLPEPVNRWAKG